MKQFILLLGLVVSSVTAVPAFADGCYLCGSGSSNSCQQCRYGAKDSGEARKTCENKGCKISGTGSCSSAANVKVCKLHTPDKTAPVIAWCAPAEAF